MDEFTGGYKMLENVFENNENFDDAEFVEEVIEELENVLRLNRNRKDNDILAAGKAYPNKIAEIEAMLAKAKQIQKTVQERLTARLREDKLGKKFQIHQLYKTIGIGEDKKMKKEYLQLFKTFLPEDKVDEILNAFQKSEFIKAEITPTEEISMFDPSYFYAFMDLLYSLPTEEQTNFTQGLRELVSEKPQLSDKIEKAVRLSRRPIDKLDRVLYALELLHSGEVSNYRKLFKDLIATLQDTSSLKDFDSNKKSAVWQFMNYEQLFKFQRDAKTQDRPDDAFLTKESLIGIVDNFIPFIFLEEIDNHIKYGKSNLMILTDNNTILRNNKSKAESGSKALFTPTSEQTNAINGIVSAYYRNKSINQTSPYENFVYLKGPAGSGKTNVVVRWVLALLPQLKSKNILASGHNKHSAQTLHDSIKPTHDAVTVDQLITLLEDGKIGENIKMIVLDEIGGVLSDQLKQLSDLTLELNQIRREQGKDPVTVLVMGDPNQKVKSPTGTPAIELPITRPAENRRSNLKGIHTMTTVSPLTITFRSDNPSVVMLQKVFEGATKKVKKLAGRANFRYEEIDNLDESPQGSFVDKGTANLMKILSVAVKQNPKKKKAIIVSNEKDQTFWKEKLAITHADQISSGLIEVLTVEEAQGRTIPEVFVDIALPTQEATEEEVQAINRDLYTATSRAADFVYLGNVPQISNSLDIGLEDLTEDNRKSKIDAFDEAIAENNRIIDILNAFGIVLTKEGKEEDEVEDPRDPSTKSDKPEKEDTEPEKDPDVETPTPGTDDDPVEGIIPTSDETDETDEPDTEPDDDPEVEDTEIITMKEPQANIFREIEFAGISLWKGLKKILGVGKNQKANLITLHNGQTDKDGNLVGARLALVMPAEEGNYAILGVFTREEINQYNIDFDSVPVSK